MNIAGSAEQNNGKRLFYIDNLRIFLISLVVLTHFAITYGGPGGWIYRESQVAFPENIPIVMFVVINQSFFMGMFFLISAYFIRPSLDRKGFKKYLGDRLLRLGVPILFFYFLIRPVMVFIHRYFILGRDIHFFYVFLQPRNWGIGPLWFVEVLLIFTLVALLLRNIRFNLKWAIPKRRSILISAFIVGLCQFIIRIWLPVGWNLPFLNFHLPHFVQYIVLFVFGFIAFRVNWFESVTARETKFWIVFTLILTGAGFLLFFLIGKWVGGNQDMFKGGFTLSSFLYSIWEQLAGFSIIIVLIGLGKKFLNRQTVFWRNLSDSTYGVLLFHPPVIIAVAVIFSRWSIDPQLKFLILSPLAIGSSFLVSWLIRQIPGVSRIL